MTKWSLKRIKITLDIVVLLIHFFKYIYNQNCMEKITRIIYSLIADYTDNSKLKIEFKDFLYGVNNAKESKIVMFAMFESILNKHPHYNSDILKREHFLKYIKRMISSEKYKEFKDGTTKEYQVYINQIATALTSIIKQFICIKDTEKYEEITLLYFFRKHYESFEGDYTKLRKDLLKTPEIRNFQYYQQTFKIEMLHFDLITSLKNRGTEQYNQQIIIVDTNSEICFILNKLNLYCQSLNTKISNNKFKQRTYIEIDTKLLQLIKGKYLSSTPAVKVYNCCSLMLENPKEQKYYCNFKNIFDKYKSIFNEQEIQNFYTYLENCKQYFELHKRVSPPFLYQNRQANPTLFKDLLSLSRVKGFYSLSNLTETEQANKDTHVEISFILTKLNLYCQSLNTNISNNKFEQSTTIEIDSNLLQFIKDKYLPNTPALQVYYYCALMLNKLEEQKHYYDFKNIFFEHKEIFYEQEIQNFYTYLENYFSIKIKENPQEGVYTEECFEIYQNQIETLFSYKNRLINPVLFKNIVILSAQLKEFEFLTYFIKKIETYQKLPPTNNTALILEYAKAILAFCTKNYTQAETHLSNISKLNKFDDIYFEIGYRRLRIKNYYELKMFYLLDDYLKAFTKFVKNKGLNENIIYRNINFAKVVTYIFLLKNEVDENKKIKLKEKIDELLIKYDTFFKTDLSWLIEKKELLKI